MSPGVSGKWAKARRGHYQGERAKSSSIAGHIARFEGWRIPAARAVRVRVDAGTETTLIRAPGNASLRRPQRPTAPGKVHPVVKAVRPGINPAGRDSQ
jgi:hypothetical protein